MSQRVAAHAGVSLSQRVRTRRRLWPAAPPAAPWCRTSRGRIQRISIWWSKREKAAVNNS